MKIRSKVLQGFLNSGKYTIYADRNGDWSGDDQDDITLVIVGLELTKTPYNWLPKGGEMRNSRVYTAKILPQNLQGKMYLKLEDVSNYPGYCANAGTELDMDLKFNTNLNPDRISYTESSAETKRDINLVKVLIESYDFGSYGKLKATAKMSIEGKDFTINSLIAEDDGDIYDYVTIPRDEVGTNDRKGNKIADSWEKEHVGTVDENGKWSGGEWQKMYKNSQDEVRALCLDDDDEPRDPDGDGKKFSPHATSGDALTVLDEYRGFVFKTREDWGGTSGHKRLSPCRKELLMQVERMIGFKESPGKGTVIGAISVVEGVLKNSLGADLYYVVDNVSLDHQIFDRTNKFEHFARKHRVCDLDKNINYDKFVYFAFVDKDTPRAQGRAYIGMSANIQCGTAIKGYKDIQPLGIKIVQYYGYLAAHEIGHVLKAVHWDGSYKLLDIRYANDIHKLQIYRRDAFDMPQIFVIEDDTVDIKIEIDLYKVRTMSQLVKEINKYPDFKGTTLINQRLGGESSWSLNVSKKIISSEKDSMILFHFYDRSLMESLDYSNTYYYDAIIKPQFDQYNKYEVNFIDFKSKL